MEIAVQGPLIVNDALTALRAAVDGVGITYSLEGQTRAWLAAGKLVRVLEDWSPRFPGFYIYYPGRRHTPPILKAFIDFLREKTP